MTNQMEMFKQEEMQPPPQSKKKRRVGLSEILARPYGSQAENHPPQEVLPPPTRP